MTIDELFQRLAATKEVVYDAETSGLDWKRCHTVGHVITFGQRDEDTDYLPFRHAGGGNIEGVEVPQTKDGWRGDIHPIEKELMRLLDRPDLTVMGHNLSFDLKFMYRLGHKFDAKYEDSIINAPLINEHQSSFSLEYCCKAAGVTPKKTDIYEYLMAKFPEARTAPKQAMGHYWRLAGDDEVGSAYARGDGASTMALIHAQRTQMASEGLDRVWGVECRLIPVLARMSTRGVKIDQGRLDEVRKIVEGRLAEAKQALPEGFNSRAPTQVRALMEKGGFTGWPLTPKGQPSFPESWLSTNPIGAQIVASRKYSNILSSFIRPMLETHIWNGRVHPEYNQLRGDEYGTITGRLSSSHPNLQQVHKRNKELGKLYRSIFVPDEGKVWASVDYSQCEPRLLAYYSRAKILLDGYRSDPPVDAHQAVAVAANIDREMGKRVNQTIITGGGRKVITDRYGVPPDKVEEVWQAYFKAMPELKPFQYKAADVMKSRGYVMSLLGRRSRLKDRNKAYVAVNRLLQMGNAEVLKIKMVELDDYFRSTGRTVDLLNNVHDAFDMQFEEKDRAHYAEALRIMTSFGPDDAITLDVPMLVDAGEGRNWSEATWGP